jgi:co-chaperonin GroES (HSP10)
LIEPRNDYLIVRRDEPEQGLIVLPDIAEQKSIHGTVLRIGPGKWVPGEWWKFKTGWEWIEGYREPLKVHPGQRISFNSRWNDFAANFEDDLPLGHDARLHLIKEGDIFIPF